MLKSATNSFHLGHYGVTVKVLSIIKSTVTVEYLTPGWKSELPGDTGKVELLRLKTVVESKVTFQRPPNSLVDYAKKQGSEGLLAQSLVDEFFAMWYRLSILKMFNTFSSLQ